MVASLLDIPDHIQCPHNVELKVSQVDDTRIGAFCSWPIAKGTEFGPFKGRIVKDNDVADVDPNYSWEVFDLATLKYLHTVDATNPDQGTWMRYVCCARYFEEQNIVSNQHGEEVYYKALKHIKPGDELLTWFNPKKKKRKRSSIRQSMDLVVPVESTKVSPLETTHPSSSPAKSPEKMKRKRKPKIIPDSYDGPLELELRKSAGKPQPKLSDDLFEPLQPGQKRRRRKKLSTDVAEFTSTSVPTTPDTENAEASFFDENIKSVQSEKESTAKEENTSKEIKTELESPEVKKDGKKEPGHTMSISEINNSVEWTFPERGNEYSFDLKKHHVVTQYGKKIYKCDICLGLYKHMFSLKRHYLRNHINYKYLSKADMTNCLINLSQVIQNINERSSNKEGKKEKTIEADDDNKVKEEVEDPKLKPCDLNIENSDNTENESNEREKSEETHDEVSINGAKKLDLSDTVIKLETTEDTSTSADNQEAVVKEGKEQNTDKDGCINSVKSEAVDDSLDDLSEINSSLESDKSSEDLVKLEQSAIKTENEPEENGSNSGDLSKEDLPRSDEKNGKDSNCVNVKPVAMPGLFQCYTCYDLFDTLDSICEHVQNHPEPADGTCFSCDQCNMRFNYKQNLVRHKKVHEVDSLEPRPEPVKRAKPSIKATKKEKVVESTPVSASAVRDIDAETACVNKYREYRCGKCRLKFESLEIMTKHVHTEHKTGGKFQCQYCGKDFPSLPNMKKHVRFHLGYRVSCRFCTEVFPNVGCLRKHTRIFHPDIYKAKQLDKIARDGVLRRPDKRVKPEEDISKKQIVNSPKVRINEKLNTSVEVVKNKVKSDEDFVSDHEISFGADEIDDGGSRFKFSCTVCKKRFSTYLNMCRHRRRTHSHDSKQRSEESLTFGRKVKNNSPPPLENPAEVALFYANVSHNIATNLNSYIDGKPESLDNFVDHIKIDNYGGSFGYKEDEDNPIDLTWERYNFPRDYKPAKTVSFADIKNELDIHNDFDSHCTAVDNHTSETEVTSAVAVSDKGKEETADIEDTDSDITTSMGKSSTGMTALASVVIPGMQKSTNKATEATNVKAENKFLKLKIPEGRIMECPSPATKNFNQVINGEYANFEDDLLPSDVDSPIIERSQSVTSSYSWTRRKKHLKDCKKGEESSQSNTSDSDSSSPDIEELNKTAKEEIAALYQSIDSPQHEQDVENVLTSPKSLSNLCEIILGLGPCMKKRRKKTSKTKAGSDTLSKSDHSLFKKLSLSANQNDFESKSSTHEKKDIEPDYSDAPDGSPFYNYESIAFGKNGQVVSVCAICKKHFCDFESLLRHHWKKHPASVCNFLEVEEGHEIEALHFTEPSYVGALAVTDPGLNNVSGIEAFTCTLCGSAFKTVVKLHSHIVSCAPIDPVYGISKSGKSPIKTPLAKRIQRKFTHVFNSKEHNLKLKLMGMKNNAAEGEIDKTQKRVFTGCRKRTSVILPDSPVKIPANMKLGQEVTTGYNPQNHIRRRELTMLVDTLTCEGCGLKFKTIILLERHVKHCTKKEKFKNVRPMTCPIMDESLAKLKNVCFYCNKHFTYMKSLLNHFQDFCLVKKSKLLKGELTEKERKKEEEIIERLLKQEEEKIPKEMGKKENEASVKRKQAWQVGRKPKRKGHAWTYIKKKKPSLTSVSSLENKLESDVMEDDDNGVIDNDDSGNDSLKSLSESSEALDDIEDEDLLLQNSYNTEESSEKRVPADTEEGKDDECSVDECDKSKAHCDEMNGYDEVDSASVSELQKYLENDIKTNSEVLDPADFDKRAKDEKFAKTVESTGTKTSIETESIMMKLAKEFQEGYETIGEETFNTSLNCTSRYRVNEVHLPKDKKHQKVQKEHIDNSSKSSLVFQCIARPLEETGQKEEQEVEIVHKEDKKNDNLNTDTGSQLIRSKRKRERVGKVEEFLRNAFKRKRKKKDIVEDSNTSKVETVAEKQPVKEVKNVVETISTNMIKDTDLGNDINIPCNKQQKKKPGRPFGTKKNKMENIEPSINDNCLENVSEIEGSAKSNFGSVSENSEIRRKPGRPHKGPFKMKVIKDKTPRKRGRPLKIKKQCVDQPKLDPQTEESKIELHENEEKIIVQTLPEIDGQSDLMKNDQFGHADSLLLESDKVSCVEVDHIDNLNQRTTAAIEKESNEKSKNRGTAYCLATIPCQISSSVSNICKIEETEIKKMANPYFENNIFKKSEMVQEESKVSEKICDEVPLELTTNCELMKEIASTAVVTDVKNVNIEIDMKTVKVDSFKSESHEDHNNKCIPEMGCVLDENVGKFDINVGSEKALLVKIDEMHNETNTDYKSFYKNEVEMDETHVTVIGKNEDGTSVTEIDGNSGETHVTEINRSVDATSVTVIDGNLNETYLSETGGITPVPEFHEDVIKISVTEDVHKVDEIDGNFHEPHGNECDKNVKLEATTTEFDGNKISDYEKSECLLEICDSGDKKVELIYTSMENQSQQDLETVVSDSETDKFDKKSCMQESLTEDSKVIDMNENSQTEIIETTNESLSASEEKYEMVLSPSERVKMNKRSCKKDIDPFSPVWVKQTKKPKTKEENEIAKTCDKSLHARQIGRRPLFKKQKGEKVDYTAVLKGYRKSNALVQTDPQQIIATKELQQLVNEKRKSAKSDTEVNKSKKVSNIPETVKLDPTDTSSSSQAQSDSNPQGHKLDNNPKGVTKRKMPENDSGVETKSKCLRKETESSKIKTKKLK